MKSLLFVFAMILFLSSCGEDPCDIPDNLECATADNDGDGVPNGDDIAPLDPCQPNLPTFADNLIGIWDYSGSLILPGRVQINEDGTYDDIEGEIVSNGTIASRTWTANDVAAQFRVESTDGLQATITLPWSTFDCDFIAFDAFPILVNFERVN